MFHCNNNNNNNNNNDNGNKSDIDKIITLIEAEHMASKWTSDRPDAEMAKRKRGTGETEVSITIHKLIDLTQIRFCFKVCDSALAFLHFNHQHQLQL